MTFKPINAITIPADGPAAIGTVSQDITTLQGIVGGYIEAVYAMHDEYGQPNVIIWCNEDGMRLDLPINRRATAFWYALAGGPTGNVLRGTVLLTGGDDGEGDMLPAPDLVIDAWKSLHDAASN